MDFDRPGVVRPGNTVGMIDGQYLRSKRTAASNDDLTQVVRIIASV